MAIGDKIREARKTLNLSQTELADKIGVSQAMVSYWERNVGIPGPNLLSQLVEICGPLGDADEPQPEGEQGAPRDSIQQEIEGLENPTDDGFSQYPIDSLMIRHETRTIHDVLRRIEKGQFVLDPDFQRAFVWDAQRQSRLIESVLMRIPLPVMYLAETPDGKLIVVDGLQRLSTFNHFVTEKKLKLTLDQPELKGKRFPDLDMRLQNRIEDTNLILYVIDSKVPERVRLDIFERVNSGIPLTRQQMRNCLYNGMGTRWLRERSESPAFSGLFSKANLDEHRRAMRDREIVNRFAAFSLLGWEAYKGDMDAFLGDALRKLNTMPEEDRAALTVAFDRGVSNNVTLFDRMAFRRHEEGQTRGTRFNVALFDVLSTALGQFAPERVEDMKSELRAMFYNLLSEDSFWDSVAYGTNQRDRVRIRFTRVHAALKEVLGDS